MTVNSVRLGPEIDARLNELAERLACSRSDIIRWALVAYFERHARESAAPAPDNGARVRLIAEAAGWKGLVECLPGNDETAHEPVPVLLHG
jgi:hypothetical protein